MRDARQLETPSPAKPEDDPTGETRRIISRRNWRASRGVTQSFSTGCAEGCDPSRRLEDPSPARPEDAETGSTPGTHREAHQAQRSCRDTWNFTAGCVEGCEVRGNSKFHRRQSLKMQDAGQLATSLGGATGTAMQGGDPGRANW